jgi:tetratricopeptide (TPR) repeat protein
MQEERLKLLLDFLEKEPNDPFNRYAVAMELILTDLDAAQEHLEILMKEHQNYLATYYQLAKIYFDKDFLEEAEEVYLKGIKLAKEQGNEKTERELKGAYEMLQDEMEEW